LGIFQKNINKSIKYAYYKEGKMIAEWHFSIFNGTLYMFSLQAMPQRARSLGILEYA